MGAALRKHQIKFSDPDWARLCAHAERDGIGVGALLVRCYNEVQRRNGHVPLLDLVAASPELAGSKMLVAVLQEHTIDGACSALGATREQWDEAVKLIPGLADKIRIVNGDRRG